jgi:ribosomal protein S18 acetylase RimI-like enzyme
MEITISPFTLDDYEAVMDLWLDTEGVGLSSADSKESIQFYLEHNPDMSFLATHKDKLVGAILSGHDGRRGYIHHLAVHPDYRREGIGSALVDECLDKLEEIGIKKCHLFIILDNLDGILFWQNTGWMPREDIGVMSMELE